MEKDTWKERADEWKNAAEEASSLIIKHSLKRLLQHKLPYQPEHTAYMALAVTIDKAIKAFIALDESLK